MKRVVPRIAADRDVDRAIDYYSLEVSEQLSRRFLLSIADGLRTIAARPGAGSPRWGNELSIDGLRSRRVARFPYLIFYIEYPDHVEVLRVLHDRSDLYGALLIEAAASPS